MMDQALDLVDVHGVPEDGIRFQRLEVQCAAKSAARYEIQSDNCNLCNALIGAVGMKVWQAAKDKRDRDEENTLHADIEHRDVAVASARRKQLVDHDYMYDDEGNYEFGDSNSTASVGTAKPATIHTGKKLMHIRPDNVIHEFSFPKSQTGKATTYQSRVNAMSFLEKHDAGNPETALEVVLASRMDPDDYCDGGNIYDADGDDSPVDVVGKANRRVSHSGAPSPSYAETGNDNEPHLGCKSKREAI